MYKFYVIFKRDLINLMLNPMLLFYNTAFPFLLIVIMGFLGSGSYGNSGVNSYDYYGVTIMIYAVLNVSVTASNSFMEKSLKTSNLRIMYSPIRTSYIYLSKITATFVFTSASYMIIMLLLNLFFGVNYGGKHSIEVILVLLVFSLMSSILGVLFCCIFKSEEVSNKILSMANNVFAILGGLFFQLDGLGKAIERLTLISPVKWVSVGIFKTIYDSDTSYFLPVVLILIALSALLLLACKLTFRTEDYV